MSIVVYSLRTAILCANSLPSTSPDVHDILVLALTCCNKNIESCISTYYVIGNRILDDTPLVF